MAGEFDSLDCFPSEWHLRRVGDFANVKGGKRLPLGTALVQTRTSHPYLRIVDFKAGRIDRSNLMFVPNDVFPSIARYTISSQDIYISIVGTIGLVGIVDNELDGANLTENAAKICDIADGIDRDYLSLFLRSGWGQHQISALTVGSTQPKLALFRIEDIQIPVPPLDEQRAIAHILGALDDKIELNRRMSETLEAMARALFKSWFVDFDPVRARLALSGAEGAEGRPSTSSGQALLGLPQPLADLFPARLVDSELGEIPVGWEVGALGDVLGQVVDRCAPSEATRSRPYVPIECIAARSLLLAESKPGEEAQSSLTGFRKGDLLFGAMRPYFHKVAIAPCDGTTRTTVFVLRPHEAQGFGYAALLLHDPTTIEYATNHSTGSTIPYAVWQGSLDSMPIVLAPAVLRRAFDQIVRPLIDRIPPVFFANRTLAALRDTLLPKLISGELRVKDAEKFIGKAV